MSVSNTMKIFCNTYTNDTTLPVSQLEQGGTFNNSSILIKHLLYEIKKCLLFSLSPRLSVCLQHNTIFPFVILLEHQTDILSVNLYFLWDKKNLCLWVRKGFKKISGKFHFRGERGLAGVIFHIWFFLVPNGLKINFRHWNFFHV